MSLIPQRKTILGESSVNSNEMNHHSSPSKKSLIPGARKTNLPDNKASLLVRKSKVDSVSKSGGNLDISNVPGLQVAVRVRPLNSSEQQRGRVWKALNKYSSITQTTRDGEPLAKSERVIGKTFFTYDKSFGENTSTDMVYESVAKGIVHSVVTGVNGTVFAYGQTSSGKTYTMQGAGSIADGAKPGAGGIIHMAAKDIFRQIAMTRDRSFVVKASFLEIYNEEVRDLLSADDKTLSIRENGQKGVFVECTEETVSDAKSLVDVIHRGEQARVVASTAMNERSSRSHTIIRITVESSSKFEEKENMSTTGLEYDTIRHSTLSLVDLAGSESVRLTGATADRQKEGGMINQSLLALSRVVSALGSSNQSFVNFRDSKLTRILQSTLSGKSKISFICCITPSEGCLEETRSTLQFASRAKRVKVQAEVNEVVNDSATIERLQRQLTSVQREAQKNEAENCQKLAQALLESKNAQRDLELAETKNKKVQELIANGEHFFGGPMDITRVSNNKRRLSEADVLGTPKKVMTEVAEPPSDTRAYKLSRVTKETTADIDLLLATLRAKDQRLEEKQGKLSEILLVLQSTDNELKEALGENELLSAQEERSRLEISSLSSKIQVLKAELASQDEALKRKESSLQTVNDSWQKEISLRNTVEQEVERLTREARGLQEQLDIVNRQFKSESIIFEEKLSRASQQMKHLEEEKRAIEDELAQKQEHLAELTNRLSNSDEMIRQIRFLLFNAGFERDQLVSRNQQCSLLISELQQSVAEYETNLAHMVVALRTVREELCEQADRYQALEDEVNALEASETSLKNELVKVKSELEYMCTQNASLEEEIASSNAGLKSLHEKVLHQDLLIEDLNQKAEKYDKAVLDCEEASIALAKAEKFVTLVKKELDEQTLQSKKLTMELENSRTNVDDLQSAMYDKDQMVNELKQSLTSVQNEIKAIDKQLIVLREENEYLKDAAAHSQDTISGLEQKQAEAELRSESLEASLAQLNIIEQRLRAELDFKATEHLKLVSDYECNEKEMREAMRMLENIQTEYASIKAENGEKREQLVRLERENIVLQKELSEQSNVVTELKSSKSTLEEELNARAAEMEETNGLNEVLRARLQEYSDLDAQLHREREAREISAANHEGTISALETQLSDAIAKVRYLEQEIEEAHASEAKLRSEISENSNIIEELRNQGQSFESVLSDKESELTLIGKHLDESRNEVAQLHEMMGTYNKRCTELEELVADQTSKIEMQSVVQREQAFTPFPPGQVSCEVTSVVSGIKCSGETTTWTCRLCKKEDDAIDLELSEKGYAFNWLSRDASASHLRAVAIDHAEKEGHEVLWNFAKKDSIDEEVCGLSRGASGARWSLLQAADISTYEEFRNDVSWPPKSPSGLIAYSVKRFARAEGVLLQASAHMFKKINGGKAVTKGDNVRDDCRAVLQIHYQAIVRAIERNWTAIQAMSSQEVYVRIQDILIGGHYRETALYVPSDDDAEQIFRS
ncbi:kinesin family member 5 [Fistulifera solaris]|uniref:Kinesin family member 5 n=1 Tax=Fistulifera solaris TaxID=1519565 RepID=A0A1Z5JN08_FISSO|nr:kinesin family member 5 [Fistulifera solaris]|eukprot:GAX15403.1 kinesin family member 5 [Fistulifera solaris]